jgi:hypothetical protein
MRCSRLDRNSSLADEATGRGIVCHRRLAASLLGQRPATISALEPKRPVVTAPSSNSNSKDERKNDEGLDYKKDFLCVMTESRFQMRGVAPPR